MRSLRRHLLGWLMLPMLVLWAYDFSANYKRSVDQLNAGLDRTLLGSALMMAERITTEQGTVHVDIPVSALEMLEIGFRDRIYYAITDEGSHTLVTGYDDLPAPEASPRPGRPVFYDAEYRGVPVRAVALLRPIYDATVKGPALVRVAQSTDTREAMQHDLMVAAVVKEAVTLAAVALLVWFGVRFGLAPLRNLRDRVAARAEDDVTPMPSEDAPREVAPLIDAINMHTARQARLLDTQRRFIADASHQLKTPLTVLKTQAELALRQQEPERMREIVRQMRDATGATARVVEQLLALARSDPQQTIETTELDLAQLARDTTLEFVPAALEKSIDLGYDGAHWAPLTGNRLLLRELLANLIDNAIRYVPPGGHVTVRVLAAASGHADGVTLEVEDDGPGIAPAERERVAERFYRPAGSPGSGAGLGLAIVREIARQHRGDLALLGVAGGRGLRAVVRFGARDSN